jgi:hypothetical protein
VRFEDGWFGETKSATINFITANVVYVMLAVLLYRSSPWKQQIWTNRPLFLIILLNTLLVAAMSLWTSELGGMGLQPIARGQMAITWGIMLVAGAGCGCFNMLLGRTCFREGNLVRRSDFSSVASLQEYS